MAVSNVLLESLSNPPTVNVSESFDRGRQNALFRRLTRAQVEAVEFENTPEARGQQRRAQEADILKKRAEASKIGLDNFNSASEREQDDAISFASMFGEIQSGDIDSLARLARTHPIDSSAAGVTVRAENGQIIMNPDFFGSQQEDIARIGADVVLNAARTRAGIGRAPVKPDATLVEIADADSPTGTRFVRRADAIGQPGKPPSGTRLTVGPDGQVEFTQGRGGFGAAAPVSTERQTDRTFIENPAAVESALGPEGFVKNLLNIAADFTGNVLPFEEAERAENDLRQLRFQTLGIMQETIPGRPNQLLLEQIEKLTEDLRPNKLFSGEQSALQAVNSIKSLVDSERASVAQFIEANQDILTSAGGIKMLQKLRDLDTLSNSYGALAQGLSASNQGAKPIESFVRN